MTRCDFSSNSVRVAILFLSQFLSYINCQNNSDIYLYGPDLITKYGYPCEVHHTTTEDGYILEMHRIPHGKNENGSVVNKVPILVQHGLLGSSDDFILLGPGRALAYLLADDGFDVWLGNSRGSRFSRSHVTLDIKKDEAKYWNFTWHELGIYDNPAYIDYILNVTKRKNLLHIGYSQGCTAFYVMGSERPEYLKKIIAHVSYAPATFFGHITSPLFRYVSTMLYYHLDFVVDITIGKYEFRPSYAFLNNLASSSCTNPLINKVICKTFVFAILGFNQIEMDNSFVPVISSHFPAGAGSKQVLHYGQLINSFRFCQYDFKNGKRPADYNLTKIDTPIHIFNSIYDWLTVKTDTDILKSKLRNLKNGKEITKPYWTHGDFVYAKTAKEELYDDTLKILQQYKSA